MDRLERPFEIIALDWDGTAVTSRQADATSVRERLERLLRHGVHIVIITGTSFTNVDRQVSATIVGRHKQRLFVCTNRGSEVFGFDDASRPIVLWRRVATTEENGKLSAIAERVRREIESRSGLTIDIVYNRLNRRKIDLIPLPEWQDPPKERIGELLRAVEDRLRAAGITGGLQEAIALVERVSAEGGMAGPRITSDVKHIEVGLTDKGDSVEWMIRELVEKHGLALSDVLIAGDEFGPIDGFPGSDYKMVAPAAGAVFVSVGKEPNGVPPEVIHLGGGPERFLALLDQQLALREPGTRAQSPSPPIVTEGSREAKSTSERAHSAGVNASSNGDADTWELVEEGFSLAREHEVESIYSVGNGYLGTRGSLGEGTPVSRPATFVAGVFDVPQGWTAGKELAKAPDWTTLRIYVAGEELRLDRGEMVEHRRVLDLKHGMLRREWRHRDPVGRITRLDYLRFASLDDRHALAESVSIVPENYGATMAVEVAIDGSLAGPGELSVVNADGCQVLTMRVAGSDVSVALAMAAVFEPAGEPGAFQVDKSGERVLIRRWEWPGRLGAAYRVDKLVAIHTSREGREPEARAADQIAKLEAQGFVALRQAHERAWAERWHRCDVEIPGDDYDQRGMRFAVYQLVSAANPQDTRVSIGARGLTGEAYKGHVFWDTETFMLPFFTFTDPPAARSLLCYRFNTLPAARLRAEAMGYRGALYAWESTTNGEDVTPRHAITPEGKIIRILCGEMEHHISADVAFAVSQYWRASGDDDFLLDHGLEIVLETARFWASRALLETDGRYHIRHVIGPDEYHEDVDDNAYTNVMAQWNLESGLALCAMASQRWPERWQGIAASIELQPAELDHWREVAERMYTGFDPSTGMIEQFRGYFALEDIDLRAYRPRTAPVDVLLGRQRTQASQIIKQADVVMLLYLHWDRFPPEVRAKNFEYYETRCDHGSSLSPGIHAAVAARLGNAEMARRYFRQTVDIDLVNNMGNAASGVHVAAQGALWQAAAFGFAGLHLHENHPAFDTNLPNGWHGLCFPLHWRDRQLRFGSRRRPCHVEVELKRGAPMCVAFGESHPQLITPDKPRAVYQARPRHYEEEL